MKKIREYSIIAMVMIGILFMGLALGIAFFKALEVLGFSDTQSLFMLGGVFIVHDLFKKERK